MSRLLLSGLLIFIFLASQSSCGIFRRGARKPAGTDTAAVAVPPDSLKRDTVAGNVVDEAKRALMAALTPVWKKQADFRTFSGKAKMHYEGRGQKQEFTSNFRIRKNEVIWVYVTALGGIVPVARVYITPDSLKLINYLEKEVTVMPLSDASKVLPAPADFNTLQNLIIGSVLRTTGVPTDAADLGSILSLQVEEHNFVQQINYNKPDSTISTLQMRTADLGGPAGMIQFSDYQVLSDRKFPMNRTINVMSAGDQYYLDMNFNKAEFDQHLDFPFSVPKNYKLK